MFRSGGTVTTETVADGMIQMLNGTLEILIAGFFGEPRKGAARGGGFYAAVAQARLMEACAIMSDATSTSCLTLHERDGLEARARGPDPLYS